MPEMRGLDVVKWVFSRCPRERSRHEIWSSCLSGLQLRSRRILLHRFLQDVADGVKCVVIAVVARKDNYSKFHAVIAPWGIWRKPILPHPAHASPAFQNRSSVSFRLADFHDTSVI